MAEGAVRRFLKSALRGDRRRGARYTLDGRSAAIGADRTLDVTIHDLSLTGALIEGSQLPGAGRAVTLSAEGLHTAGRVVWREGDRAGLRFDRPLSVEQLFTIVHCCHFHPGAGLPAALAA
jgi:hypothetical protein